MRRISDAAGGDRDVSEVETQATVRSCSARNVKKARSFKRNSGR